MPLSSLICASIETSLNKLLALDNTSAQRQTPLQGQTVGLEISELKQPLFFHFSPAQVEVLSQFEGDVAVHLKLNFNTLIALKNDANIGDLIKSDQLVIEGDIKTLQYFADLLTKLDIDWQEHLSQYTGDVAAYRLGQGASKLSRTITNGLTKVQSKASDYFTHEARIMIGKLEFVHFSDQVDELAQRCAALNKQIDQLKDKS